MAKLNYNIVVLEDDPSINKTLINVLAPRYERVECFLDAKEGLDKIHTVNPDLIISDIFLGSYNGIDILERLRSEGWNRPIIMMTAIQDINLVIRAMKAGAVDFLMKPLFIEQLELAVKNALENRDKERKGHIAVEELNKIKGGNIIGSSDVLQNALRLAEAMGKAGDSTILLTGESGTGKELFSRFMHKHSSRAKGPFIPVNCGALPKELAENELFGHEKGAFTGAVTKDFKEGFFDMAQHGTLLLDEVGELTPDLQTKLLRVLENKKFYRIGGSKEIAIDVRVIAATNKNLEQAIEEGSFRQDLYYRLNVGRLHLPPLRDRGNDIMELAATFREEFNKKYTASVVGFSPDAVDVLMKYNWRGNVRELRNVMERVMMLHNSGDYITASELDMLQNPTSMVQVPMATYNVELQNGGHFLKISKNGASMSNVVKDLLIQTLKLTNGNQVAATKMLDTTRARLRYKIEQLGIMTEKLTD